MPDGSLTVGEIGEWCEKSYAQDCPLCGQKHPLCVEGIVKSPDATKVSKVMDKGYSFCNCNNIFFTDWSNINQGVYDSKYLEKYQSDDIKKLILRYCEVYFPLVSKYGTVKSFTEIGSVNDVLLDHAQALGWETSCIDINKDLKTKHKLVVGNADDEIEIPKSDFFWMSHIFEHFKDPITVAKKIYEKTNPGGFLFVAMPDPWFIDWNAPYLWGHWNIREHHIMWDMDSFIDRLIDIGYEFVMSRRNPMIEFICYGDYHILMRKPNE